MEPQTPKANLLPPLFSHQESDVKTELVVDRLFDASDPGTGKTRTRLEAYSRRRASGAKCLLVIAPKSLLKMAWENDNQKFTPWLKVSCAYAENREEAFKAAADIYVTNHDAVKWLAKQAPSFFDKFSDLVVDESGAFKHRTSQRSKALGKIKKYFPKRVCMNGTPNTNSITDVWNQINILDDGQRLGPSFFAFRAATQIPEQVGPQPNMVKWTDRPGAEHAVGDLIRDITIRHTLEECVSIPANHSYSVPFELTPKLDKAYQQMEAQAILQLSTGTVTAINAAAVVTKLLQIASGAVYDSEEAYHIVDTARYETIADLVEARKFSVVFFNWIHQRDLLQEEFKKRGITYTTVDGSVTRLKRDKAIEHFQNGFYRVLLAHPKSAAHGLTLTKGTSTIWSSPTYNLEHWIQGNRRIYRAGQTEKTETVNIIAPGTLEEKVFHVLTNKGVRMMDLLDILKEMGSGVPRVPEDTPTQP